MTSTLQTGYAHDAVQYFSACLVLSSRISCTQRTSLVRCTAYPGRMDSRCPAYMGRMDSRCPAYPGRMDSRCPAYQTVWLDICVLAYWFLCTLRLLIPSHTRTKQSLEHFCLIQSRYISAFRAVLNWRQRSNQLLAFNPATQSWKFISVSLCLKIRMKCSSSPTPCVSHT